MQQSEITGDALTTDYTINGVLIHSPLAFEKLDDWYSDLINRAIPKMGKYYMTKFIEAGFSPAKWFDLLREDNIEITQR